MPSRDVKAATRFVVQVDQRHQHQQRPRQRVEEELERCVDPARAAPDADDDVHRDQRGLEEHIEQQTIGSAEHAHHQTRQDQESPHVLGHPVGDHLPASHHHDDVDESGEQHEPDRNTVDAEVIVHIETRDPGQVLLELQRRTGVVKARDQRDRDQKAGHRADQRQPARHARLVVAAQRQQQDADRYRQPDRNTQKSETHFYSPPCRINGQPGRKGKATTQRATTAR